MTVAALRGHKAVPDRSSERFCAIATGTPASGIDKMEAKKNWLP